MVEVYYTDEFAEWFEGLESREQGDVDFVVQLLAAAGTSLGFPHSSAIKGSKHALRELRPSGGRSPLRLLYAFDPKRDAVLLVGGDKGKDKQLYVRLIPLAKKIWDQYLAEQKAGLHEAKEKK